MEENSLHNVHETVCDEVPTTTRLGSNSRIDFIMATDGILPCIRAAGFRSIHKAIVSDHILLSADVDM